MLHDVMLLHPFQSPAPHPQALPSREFRTEGYRYSFLTMAGESDSMPSSLEESLNSTREAESDIDKVIGKQDIVQSLDH